MGPMSARCLRLGALLVLLACGTSCAAVRNPGGGQAPEADRAKASGERLLVRRASLEVAVQDVAVATRAAEALARELGGFVESSRTRVDGPSRLVVRIPEPRLEEGLDRLAALGEERERSLAARDVTDEVADVEARLRSARALRDRLRALLARAEEVEEVLSIEKELARVQLEVETLEARLERLRGDVALARVDVALWHHQREILGPLGYALQGLGWILEKLFVIRPGSP